MDKKAANSSVNIPPDAYLLNLSKRRLWGTESNALEKSVKMTWVLQALSRLSAHSCIVSRSWVWQEWPLRKAVLEWAKLVSSGQELNEMVVLQNLNHNTG